MKTIKHLCLAILLLLMVNVSNAQVKFGVIGGIGGSTQSDFGNIYNNDDLMTGFDVGVTIWKPFSEKFALKTNLFYSLKGRSYSLPENGECTKYNEKFNYLTLPVKAEYSIPISENRLFVGAGPYAGVLLNAKQKTENNSAELNNATEDFDFGLAFELGFGTKLFVYNELQFSISYDMGLRKVTSYDTDLRNKSLFFNVGFLF